MSVPLILGIVVAFSNGQPVDTQIIGGAKTAAECKQALPQIVANSKQNIPAGVTIVAKCYDFGSDAVVAEYTTPGVTPNVAPGPVKPHVPSSPLDQSGQQETHNKPPTTEL
jgi:hypothetical protein